MARKKGKDKLAGAYIYDPGLLHFIFFVSSAAIVILWFAMLGQDYAREWKGWQKAYFAEETRRLEDDLQEERNQIQDDLAQLEADLQAAEQRIESNSDSLEALRTERDEVARALSNAERELKFEKARQDERRYNVERQLTEVAHDRDVETYDATLAYKIQGDPTKHDYESSELELLDEVSAWEGFVEGARKIEVYTERVKSLQKEQDRIDAELERITGTKEALLAKRQALTLGIDRLQNQIAKVDARPSNVFRNLPGFDFMAPQLEIKQNVVQDIFFDVNFMQVEAVDRCRTCHIAIDKPGYEDMPNPLKTHPQLVEMYNGGILVDSQGNSEVVAGKHPFEGFGCTVCHSGRGRATSFVGAVHTPSTHEQEEEWVEKYGWYEDHYWDFPMLPQKYVHSSCYQCHAGEPVLPGAGPANDARAMVQQAGCYSCHKIGTGGFTELPKPGPNLRKVASKTTRQWAWNWLQSPRSFRKETLMPHFWGLLNNSRTAEDRARNEVEIHSIVTYLFETSQIEDYDDVTLGDTAHGEALLHTKGCLGCHQIGYDNGVERWEPRHHGPNLTGVGSKVGEDWLVAWLLAPQSYHPETKMPDLRLTDEDARDIAAYLMTLRDPAWEARAVPDLDEEVLAEEVYRYKVEKLSEEDARSEVEAMSSREQQMFLAERLIARYGCFSCHDLNGPPGCETGDKPCFQEYGPIGTELTTEADKFIEKLDFGHVHIPHTKWDWFYTKLRTPRVYDTGKVVAVKDRLRMPSFGFKQEEAELLVSFIMGLRKPVVGEPKLGDVAPRAEARMRGARLIQTLNCRGCHIYQGSGGAIRPVLAEYLVEAEGMEEATAEGYFPPDITGEGAKVQSDWLVSFFQEPWEIRPWIKTVMPTFHFTNDETNALIGHFTAASEVPTFEIVDCAEVSEESIEAGRLLASDEYFKCYSCHVQGEKTPLGTPDRWAPDFQKVPERLRHDWIKDWLKNPQALQAGTKMPQFFYDEDFLPKEILGGDMEAQIRALADFLRCGLLESNDTARDRMATSPAQGTGAPAAGMNRAIEGAEETRIARQEERP